MSVRIKGLGTGVIGVSGDVETLLIATYVKRGQPFVLGFSDGSLIEGLRDQASGVWLFQTLVEGAGIMMLDDDGLTLDWRVEWVTIAPSTGVIVTSEQTETMPETAPIATDFHVGSVADWLRRQHVSAPADLDLMPSS